jgi:membrane protease subunit HflC
MKNNPAFGAVLVLVVLLLAGGSFYTVQETQQALVFQFGKIIHVEKEPGLHVKLPLIQNVIYYDDRLLSYESTPIEATVANDNTAAAALQAEETDAESAEGDAAGADVLVGEKARVIALVRFRITDPVTFYQKHVTEQAARQTIGSALQTAVGVTLAKVRLDTVLANAPVPLDEFGVVDADMPAAYRALLVERAKNDGQPAESVPQNPPAPRLNDVIAAMLSQNNGIKDTGMTIEDVRLFRVSLPDTNRDAIFRRMVTEREALAEQLRAEGRALAQQIRADAERERTIRLAQARGDAERIRGEGDAEATRIYGEAYDKDPDFYAFYRSLQAYRAGLADDRTTFLLSPDSAFFEYFKDLPGASRRGTGE